MGQGAALRLTLGFLTIVLLSPALVGAVAAAEAPEGVSAYAPHAPIRIHGDGDLTAANGVVLGSGTADDPYVIMGWDILPTARGSGSLPLTTGECGIEVRDTSAHLRIEANRVKNDLKDTWTVITLPVLGLVNGICLEDVENVAVVGNVVGPLDASGVIVDTSSDVTVEGNRIMGVDRGVDSTGATPRLRVAANTIRDVAYGIHHEGTDLLAEDNVIEGSIKHGVHLWGGNLHELIGNTLSDNKVGIHAKHSDLVLTDNHIVNNTKEGVVGVGVDATLHGNAISGNGEGVVLKRSKGTLTESTANATENWWGDASGPSDAGSGSGDSLVLLDASSADYSPWLTTEPSTGGGGGGGVLGGGLGDGLSL